MRASVIVKTKDYMNVNESGGKYSSMRISRMSEDESQNEDISPLLKTVEMLGTLE